MQSLTSRRIRAKPHAAAEAAAEFNPFKADLRGEGPEICGIELEAPRVPGP